MKVKAVVRQGLRKIGECDHLEIVKAMTEKRPGASEGALAIMVLTEVDGEEVGLTKFRLALV